MKPSAAGQAKTAGGPSPHRLSYSGQGFFSRSARADLRRALRDTPPTESALQEPPAAMPPGSGPSPAGEPPPPVAAPPRSPWRWALAAVAVVALAGAVFLVVHGLRRPGPDAPPPATDTPPPADPRLAYSGPFRNVRPDVEAVGSAACADCHADIAGAYRRHPMGRSVAPVAEVLGATRYDEAAHNPFEIRGTRFLLRRDGQRLWYRESRPGPDGKPVYECDRELHYVVGSGTHGFAYLTDHDGYVFQAPVSWYTRKGIWDLSPSFPATALAARPVPTPCLQCHADPVRPYADSLNRYHTPLFPGGAIGCERCHGPGELHTGPGGGHRDPRTGADLTIVNPRHLTPALRDAVCEQCHLAGTARVLRRGRGPYDFRPGMPLEDFWSVLVRATESGHDARAVNHVEQMHVSACYRGGRGPGRMGCVSCHDPHEPVPAERRVAHYRQRCLQCHESRACSEPLPRRLARSKDDSCIDCHMPPYSASDVVHAAATDHRIPRRPGKAHPQSDRGPRSAVLTHFYPARRDPTDRDGARDLGIGLVQAAQAGKVPEGPALEQALRLLDGALIHFPDDLDAWEARGTALFLLERPGPALTAFETVLARAPRREAALAGAAAAAQSLARADAARGYWRRAVAANPWFAAYRRNLAVLAAQANDWDEAGTQGQAWLRLDPADPEARMLAVTCLWRQGRRGQARAEFGRLEALRPPDLERFRRLFAGLRP